MSERPSSDTPWWIPANTSPRSIQSRPANKSRTVPVSVVIAIAVVAGILGSLFTRNFLAFNGSASIVTTRSTIERAPDSVAGISARVSPSVVSISAKGPNGADTGSGFFIDKSGYILTNNHVVAIASPSGSLTVNLANGKNFPAQIIGRDISYDLAVIKIDILDAPALQFGDSDKVAVGDAVIAIGSPLGLAGTVTSGIISAKNRAVTTGSGSGESSFINALQTDAAINPGNSGGPLVDLTGAVIGVNSAIASTNISGGQAGSIGLGFAIPINQAKRTADQLIKTGKSTYPIVGLMLDNTYTGIGARVATTNTSVLAGGPAARAGFVGGEIITSIDGKAVTSADEAIVAIRAHNVGERVTIKFTRNGTAHTVTVTLIAAK